MKNHDFTYRNKSLGTRPLELGNRKFYWTPCTFSPSFITIKKHYRKGKKKHNRITHAEKFQIIYIATLSSRRVSTWTFDSNVCYTGWLSSKDYGNGEVGVTLQWKNLTNPISARGKRSSSTVINHVNSTTFEVMGWKCYFTALVLLQICNSSLIFMKKSDKYQLRGIL